MSTHLAAPSEGFGRTRPYPDRVISSWGTVCWPHYGIARKASIVLR